MLFRSWDERGPILEVAEAVLQEHNLTLVRSAATLTVTGDFDEPDLDEDDEEDEEEAIEEDEALDDYVPAAVVQQLEQTADAIRLFGARTGSPLSLLFAKTTVFVGGQLLKGSRAVYTAALELGQMLDKLGLSEIVFQQIGRAHV